jgi:hypothetical protein
MKHIPDETLMAYVDGELPPDEEDAVTQAMSPPTAARALEFMRTSRRRLAEAIEELPASRLLLAEMILNADVPKPAFAPATRHSPTWLDRLTDMVRDLQSRTWTLAPAPALSLGLICGAAAAWFALASTYPSGLTKLRERPVAMRLLQRTLENNTSGTASELPSVTPTSTFANKSGGFCREYVLTYGSGRREVGLACREHDGRWDIKEKAAVTAHGNAPAGAMKPAAAEPSPANVEAAIRARIKDVPLQPDEETELIKNGWKGD